MKTIYVLRWFYYDHSSDGVLRAYIDKARADEDMVVINHNEGSKQYEIVEVPLIGEAES